MRCGEDGVLPDDGAPAEVLPRVVVAVPQADGDHPGVLADRRVVRAGEDLGADRGEVVVTQAADLLAELTYGGVRKKNVKSILEKTGSSAKILALRWMGFQVKLFHSNNE